MNKDITEIVSKITNPNKQINMQNKYSLSDFQHIFAIMFSIS